MRTNRAHDMEKVEFLKCLKVGGRLNVHIRTESLGLRCGGWRERGQGLLLNRRQFCVGCRMCRIVSVSADIEADSKGTSPHPTVAGGVKSSGRVYE